MELGLGLMVTPHWTVRVPVELRARAQQRASIEGRTLTDVVIQALHDYTADMAQVHGLTPDQVAHLAEVASRLEHDEPGRHHAADREAALTAARRLLTEDPDAVVRDLAAQLHRAYQAESMALSALREAARTLVKSRGTIDDRSASTELGFAAICDLPDSEIRAWLGMNIYGQRTDPPDIDGLVAWH